MQQKISERQKLLEHMEKKKEKWWAKYEPLTFKIELVTVKAAPHSIDGGYTVEFFEDLPK